MHEDTVELKSWVSSHIAAYKVPDYSCIMKHLPKTPTGKLDRKAHHLKAKTEQGVHFFETISFHVTAKNKVRYNKQL